MWMDEVEGRLCTKLDIWDVGIWMDWREKGIQIAYET